MALPDPSPESTCVVTGASSGIGEQIARVLAARGFGLTLVARRRPRLEELARELTAAHGVRVEVLALDMADAEARAEILPALEQWQLIPDVLVNNAGVGTTGPVHRADRMAELVMLRTNVEAVADLCTQFLPGMVHRGRGAVLNVASTAAFQPLPGQAAYAASKAFVLAYSHAVSAELQGTGVTVTTLCPGPVATEFGRTAGFSPDEEHGALPRIMWVPADEVARQAVEAMAVGRSVVVPGWANAVGAVLGHLAPRSVLLPVLARRHPALRREPG